MTLQESILTAKQQANNSVPVYVVPDESNKPSYGNELTVKPPEQYQYSGFGKSVYAPFAPGTKTAAEKQYEKAMAEQKAKAQALSQAVAASKPNAAAAKAATPAIPSNKGATGGSLDQWLSQALTLTGQDQSLLPYLRTIAMHESSGNPRAQNNWDSNAKAGHPSKGLMQTIDSTFNAYKLQGHDDIWNPVDNAIASIRYAIARYGSLANVPGVKSLAKGGKYVGY